MDSGKANWIAPVEPLLSEPADLSGYLLMMLQLLTLTNVFFKYCRQFLLIDIKKSYWCFYF